MTNIEGLETKLIPYYKNEEKRYTESKYKCKWKCGKYFQTKEMLEEHQKKEYETVCNLMIKTFNSEDNPNWSNNRVKWKLDK